MILENFDLKLFEDLELFEKIKTQSDLYIHLFKMLAEDFPQGFILTKHKATKGVKISSGYRLENCPYQVLDIVRDFDENTGWNIRLLNWWGHGLYIFVLYGRSTFEKMKLSIQRMEDNYQQSDQPSPWNYKKIITEKKKFSPPLTTDNLSGSNYFQVFKKIEIDPCPEKALSILKKEITFIFDNHY